eukprot:CAMPEP_0116882254 /NCGR_PEP_ID=MMETSP0463-20121206/14452_1 /TAXON_ID=181622 /ORGANISM="Strombidinopsis sp, Strain SopsisLIS2011" /LENGTH=66 /DNA_ID=CAMNT_0004535187 /DNA_START=753 /DNA_END=953 /DNA_ORIENTATION=-
MTKRFIGCSIKTNVLFDVVIPYQDKIFEKAEFDSDLREYIIPQMAVLDAEEPANFDETECLKFVTE